MKFEALTIQSVKSISQRVLLWYWNDLAAGRRFPAMSDFHFDARMHDPKGLLIWNIERDAGRRRFRARYHGERIAEAFQGSWVGKTMDEIVPQAVRQYGLDAAHECAESGCAVFSVISTVDVAGHRVDCERLLLPFGNGVEVEQLVASMQLISLRGNFERKTVLNDYRMTSRVELAGRISAGFAKPVITTPGLVIELGATDANIPGQVIRHLEESTSSV